MGSSRNFVEGSRLKWRRMKGEQPIFPYMKLRETQIIEEILERIQPARCLEYGSGYGSLYFSAQLPPGAEWHAIEHVPAWYNALQKFEHPPTLQLHLQEVPQEVIETGGARAFDHYINYPEPLGLFDFILIDGRARKACLQKSLDLLRPGGLVVLHDANRKTYQEGLKGYRYNLILEDFRKTSGGLGFGSHQKPIDQYFSLEDHIPIWKTATSWANFFKFKFLLGKTAKPFRYFSL